MYLGHVSGRKVVPDCRRLGRDRRLQIVGCKKDIPCVLASTLISTNATRSPVAVEAWFDSIADYA